MVLHSWLLLPAICPFNDINCTAELALKCVLVAVLASDFLPARSQDLAEDFICTTTIPKVSCI